MSAHLDKLMMQVALIDSVTKPLKGIQNTVTETADVGRSGWEKMAGGTAGVIAAGFAVQQALMPAIEMDRVLGEVKSLGVVDEDLQQLQKTALAFSVEYGKSAQEVVGAAYDIKSAFGDITGPELSDITKSSAVLAAATKADTATITDYMGTMYGVFKNQANDMGVGIWSKNVAGMTAQSVEMFKTTGKGMSDAFTSVGANATAAGIKMNEQMAILGTLQSTMSGSEAGTKYKSFLTGVGGAQDKLNMKFVDSQGAMLPMVDILNKLKGQFGDTLDVAESDALKKAFGSDEAVSMIKLLMADTNGLASSINSLGNVKGMSKAENMAGAMTDQWQRLEAAWFAIRAGAFGLILPSINAIAGSMADGFNVLLGWTQEFPVLTQYLGYFALTIVAGAGLIAAWNMVVGLASLMSAGWSSATLLLTTVMKGFNLVMRMARFGALGFAMAAAVAQVPLLPLILGIGAVVAAVGAVIYFWDDLKAAWSDFSFIESLGSMVDWLIEKINLIPGINIGGESSGIPQMDTPELNTATPAHYASKAAVPAYSYGYQAPVTQEIAFTPNVTEPVIPKVSEQSVNYGSQYSGLNAVPSYQSNVYYQNQVPAQPESLDLIIGSVVAQPEVPEVNGTVTYDGAIPPLTDTDKSKEMSAPISAYIGGSAEGKANVSQQLKQMSSGSTDNSRTQHVGDVYITQEQAFTPEDLSAWNEMSTP